MLCRILAGPISGVDGSSHNTGETIKLSESDAQQLMTWGIVEIANDKPLSTATVAESLPVPSAPVVPATNTEAASISTKDVEVPKVQPEPATTDTGSTTEVKAKASAK